MRMTESTKQLFDAPWGVNNQRYPFDVTESDGFWVCECSALETANRLARLPELYEALCEAVEETCGTCAMMMVDSASYDFVKNGCPFFEDHDDCFPKKWLDLLKKVKEGV